MQNEVLMHLIFAVSIRLLPPTSFVSTLAQRFTTRQQGCIFQFVSSERYDKSSDQCTPVGKSLRSYEVLRYRPHSLTEYVPSKRCFLHILCFSSGVLCQVVGCDFGEDQRTHKCREKRPLASKIADTIIRPEGRAFGLDAVV